jgi:hypothetical protein
MPARRKTLHELVAHRTFLARRHGPRLREEPLERADLRALQEAYCLAESGEACEAIARAVEITLRATPKQSAGQLSVAAALAAALGPDGADPELRVRWQAWDRAHGAVWRVKRGAASADDLIKLHRRVSGAARNRSVSAARAWLETHRVEVEQFLGGAEGDAPDPPLWAGAEAGASAEPQPLVSGRASDVDPEEF